MAITISFGIQKGGCSKTTTSGVIVNKLVNDGYRVLAVDMDCQGNFSELLTNVEATEFDENTILEAMRDGDVSRYIYRISEMLDIIPANNLLAYLPRFLFEKYGLSNPIIYSVLREILDPIKSNYDFIIIDTPPALSEHTVNAFVASDYVVVMFESSKWCYSAIPNFMESIDVARQFNPDLKIAGILRTLNDVRRSDAKMFNDLIGQEYPDEVFDTVIRRRAATGRLAIYGFEENPEYKDAIEQYDSFYKELMSRVEQVKGSNA